MAKNTSPLEARECAEFARVLDKIGVTYSHIPLGTYGASFSVIAKNKKMGVRKGVPDYLVCRPYHKDGHKLIFIEMKRQLMSYPSKEQREREHQIRLCGVDSYICKGYKTALIKLQEHTDNKGGDAAVWKYLDHEIKKI